MFDINMAAHFCSSYSDILTPIPRLLTSGNNKSSVDSYLSYINEQFNTHKISECTQELYTIAIQDPTSFTRTHRDQLNSIDTQVTQILLSGEKKCSKDPPHNRPGHLMHRKLQEPSPTGNKSTLC
jgi:hypothetical protein